MLSKISTKRELILKKRLSANAKKPTCARVSAKKEYLRRSKKMPNTGAMGAIRLTTKKALLIMFSSNISSMIVWKNSVFWI